MGNVVNLFVFLADNVLALLFWAIIISAVMSWLIAFDVINLRNRFVNNVHRFLEAVTRPVLAPFRRFIPSLGGVDVSPIIVILLIQGLRAFIIQPLYQPTTQLIG
jgi:YggT family protein